MEKKVPINTNVQTFTDVQRSLSELSKEIGLLKEMIDVTPTEKEDETEGLTGSIRVIKNSDNVNLFEIKTDDGWKKPMLGESQILLKKLASNIKIVNQKSIDELETEDDDTDNDIAKKTIFDEKADKFVLARPDFNSGWIWYDWSEHHWNGNHPAWKFAHTLESLPTLVSIQVAPALTGNPTLGTDEALISDQSTITWYTEMNNHFGDSYGNNQVYGLTYKVDKDYVYVDGAESQAGWISDYDDTNTDKVSFQDCSIRILLWK